MDLCRINCDQSCLYLFRGNLSHCPVQGGDVSFSKSVITAESTGSALWACIICVASNKGDIITKETGYLDKASACWFVLPGRWTT